MESALSLFRQLPETKDQVKKYHSIIREPVLDGTINALDFMVQVSAIEMLFKDLKSDILIKDAVLQEAEKYGKSFEKGNAKFQIKEMGVKFDFSNCEDFEYNEICRKIDELTEKKKERESFLKTIKSDMEVYGSDGNKLNPVVKTSTTSVAITLK